MDPRCFSIQFGHNNHVPGHERGHGKCSQGDFGLHVGIAVLYRRFTTGDPDRERFCTGRPAHHARCESSSIRNGCNVHGTVGPSRTSHIRHDPFTLAKRDRSGRAIVGDTDRNRHVCFRLKFSRHRQHLCIERPFDHEHVCSYSNRTRVHVAIHSEWRRNRDMVSW